MKIKQSKLAGKTWESIMVLHCLQSCQILKTFGVYIPTVYFYIPVG